MITTRNELATWISGAQSSPNSVNSGNFIMGRMNCTLHFYPAYNKSLPTGQPFTGYSLPLSPSQCLAMAVNIFDTLVSYVNIMHEFIGLPGSYFWPISNTIVFELVVTYPYGLHTNTEVVNDIYRGDSNLLPFNPLSPADQTKQYCKYGYPNSITGVTTENPPTNTIVLPYSTGIAILTLHAGGHNYTIGDIITVDTGSTLATCVVNSVSSGGVITALSLTTPGLGYSRGIEIATTSYGGILNISVNNNGSRYITNDTFTINGPETLATGHISGFNDVYACHILPPVGCGTGYKVGDTFSANDGSGQVNGIITAVRDINIGDKIISGVVWNFDLTNEPPHGYYVELGANIPTTTNGNGTGLLLTGSPGEFWGGSQYYTVLNTLQYYAYPWSGNSLNGIEALGHGYAVADTFTTVNGATGTVLETNNLWFPARLEGGIWIAAGWVNGVVLSIDPQHGMSASGKFVTTTSGSGQGLYISSGSQLSHTPILVLDTPGTDYNIENGVETVATSGGIITTISIADAGTGFNGDSFTISGGNGLATGRVINSRTVTLDIPYTGLIITIGQGRYGYGYNIGDTFTTSVGLTGTVTAVTSGIFPDAMGNYRSYTGVPIAISLQNLGTSILNTEYLTTAVTGSGVNLRVHTISVTTASIPTAIAITNGGKLYNTITGVTVYAVGVGNYWEPVTAGGLTIDITGTTGMGSGLTVNILSVQAGYGCTVDIVDLNVTETDFDTAWAEAVYIGGPFNGQIKTPSIIYLPTIRSVAGYIAMTIADFRTLSFVYPENTPVANIYHPNIIVNGNTQSLLGVILGNVSFATFQAYVQQTVVNGTIPGIYQVSDCYYSPIASLSFPNPQDFIRNMNIWVPPTNIYYSPSFNSIYFIPGFWFNRNQYPNPVAPVYSVISLDDPYTPSGGTQPLFSSLNIPPTWSSGNISTLPDDIITLPYNFASGPGEGTSYYNNCKELQGTPPPVDDIKFTAIDDSPATLIPFPEQAVPSPYAPFVYPVRYANVQYSPIPGSTADVWSFIQYLIPSTVDNEQIDHFLGNYITLYTFAISFADATPIVIPFTGCNIWHVTLGTPHNPSIVPASGEVFQSTSGYVNFNLIDTFDVTILDYYATRWIWAMVALTSNYQGYIPYAPLDSENTGVIPVGTTIPYSSGPRQNPPPFGGGVNPSILVADNIGPVTIAAVSALSSGILYQGLINFSRPVTETFTFIPLPLPPNGMGNALDSALDRFGFRHIVKVTSTGVYHGLYVNNTILIGSLTLIKATIYATGLQITIQVNGSLVVNIDGLTPSHYISDNEGASWRLAICDVQGGFH